MSIEAFKITVKFYAEDDSAISSHEFVPVLHSWIQQQAVPDHALIDVADYGHVHNGPGTVLVAHEANFYTDRSDGRLGFMYSRKQPASGSFQDRLRQAFAAALEGCARLEDDPRLAGRIKFRTNESLVRLNDRLLAPNTFETYTFIQPELKRIAATLYPGTNVDMEHIPSEKTLFEVRMKADESPNLPTLLSHLGRSALAPSQ
jgi:hypothetical protein